MKKKKILKIASKSLIIISIISLVIGVMAIPCFAWSWTDSVPKHDYKSGTNSFAYFPLISGTYSYNQTPENMYSGYKTYTYNAPSVVSFEYGNNFTPGYRLGREIIVKDNGVGYVGIVDYKTTHDKYANLTRDDYHEVGVPSALTYSYYPYDENVFADYSNNYKMTRWDYQVVGYDYDRMSTNSLMGRSTYELEFGTTYLNIVMLQEGLPLLIKEFIPKASITDIQDGIWYNVGIDISYDLIYFDEYENMWKHQLVDESYYPFHNDDFTLYVEGEYMFPDNSLVNGHYVYFDIGGIITDNLPDFPDNSPYTTPAGFEGSKTLQIANLRIIPHRIESPTGANVMTGVTSMECFIASERPMETDDYPLPSYEGDSFYTYAVINALSGWSGHDDVDFMVDFTGSLANGVGGFFQVEIFEGVSLGLILLIPFMFVVLLYVLKLFAGG